MKEEADYERGWEMNACQLISGKFLNKWSAQQRCVHKYASALHQLHNRPGGKKRLTPTIPTTSAATEHSWLW